MLKIDWQIGDTAVLKKPHACGGTAWRVERVGMDMRLVCLQCGRELLLSRYDFNKRVKEKLPPA